jgi:signal transduction histidine kinase
VRIDDILNGLIEIIDTQVNISEKERNIRFSSVVKKILEQYKDELPKDSKINLNFEEEEINHIRGYIFTVLRNLLSNSIQYRRQDIPLEINIETKKQGNYTLLSIEDNGIGMDFEGVSKDLFKPFKRFTAAGEGKGIGLHLVKSMVEKTGGKIEVDSEEGKGTKFYIYFKDQKSEYTSNRR